jgi:hypothetical protein
MNTGIGHQHIQTLTATGRGDGPLVRRWVTHISDNAHRGIGRFDSVQRDYNIAFGDEGPNNGKADA